MCQLSPLCLLPVHRLHFEQPQLIDTLHIQFSLAYSVIQGEYWGALFKCDAVPVVLRCHAGFLQTSKSRWSVSFRGERCRVGNTLLNFAGTESTKDQRTDYSSNPAAELLYREHPSSRVSSHVGDFDAYWSSSCNSLSHRKRANTAFAMGRDFSEENRPDSPGAALL